MARKTSWSTLAGFKELREFVTMFPPAQKLSQRTHSCTDTQITANQPAKQWKLLFLCLHALFLHVHDRLGIPADLGLRPCPTLFLTQNTAILQLWHFTSQAIFRDSRCIPLKSLFVGLHLCFAALGLPVWLHFHSRLCTWVHGHVHAMYSATTI